MEGIAASRGHGPEAAWHDRTMEQTADTPPPRRPGPDITADGYRMARLPEVMRATGLTRSTIYKLMAAGDFPASTCLTRGCS